MPLDRNLAEKPRHLTLDVDGLEVSVVDDPYSDRIRCDHPPSSADGRVLARCLMEQAEERGRGRIVVLGPDRVASGLRASGLRLEGTMPRFYRGQQDCLVLGAYPESRRGRLGDADRVREVMALVDERGTPTRDACPTARTRRAIPEDAPAVAGLLGGTFAQYPTPSSDPDYVARLIEDGVPFRLVEDGGQVVACASADLVRRARTAELTDCATRPEHRGRGLMQAVLRALMHDLCNMGYPTAFTLARACIPGVNLAFARLGFHLRGTMPRSCRIGSGIEDMNIWSRDLPARPRRDRLVADRAGAPVAFSQL